MCLYQFNAVAVVACCEDFFNYIVDIGRNVKRAIVNIGRNFKPAIVNLGSIVIQAVANWISNLISKLKAFKDQIMFVFFSLGMYIVDIGTDVWQAIDYLR